MKIYCAATFGNFINPNSVKDLPLICYAHEGFGLLKGFLQKCRNGGGIGRSSQSPSMEQMVAGGSSSAGGHDETKRTEAGMEALKERLGKPAAAGSPPVRIGTFWMRLTVFYVSLWPFPAPWCVVLVYFGFATGKTIGRPFGWLKTVEYANSLGKILAKITILTAPSISIHFLFKYSLLGQFYFLFLLTNRFVFQWSQVRLQ